MNVMEALQVLASEPVKVTPETNIHWAKQKIVSDFEPAQTWAIDTRKQVDSWSRKHPSHLIGDDIANAIWALGQALYHKRNALIERVVSEGLTHGCKS